MMLSTMNDGKWVVLESCGAEIAEASVSIFLSIVSCEFKAEVIALSMTTMIDMPQRKKEYELESRVGTTRAWIGSEPLANTIYNH